MFRRQHVIDINSTREINYLNSILGLNYPSSFSKSHFNIIKTNQQLYAALEMFRHISEPLLLDIYCNYDSSVNINWYYEEFIRINKNKTE